MPFFEDGNQDDRRGKAKRTDGQRIRDLDFIQSRFIKGIPVSQIHKELCEITKKDGYTINERFVAHEIEDIKKEWLKSSSANYAEAKAKELAHLDALEAAAWQAWELSLQEKTTEQSEMVKELYTRAAEDENQARTALGLPPKMIVPGSLSGLSAESTSERHEPGRSPLPPKNKVSTKTFSKKEMMVGDPRYLQQVQECITLRSKIFGLFEATKIAIDWRTEAKKAGMESTASEAFNDLVGKMVVQMNADLDREIASGKDVDDLEDFEE